MPLGLQENLRYKIIRFLFNEPKTKIVGDMLQEINESDRALVIRWKNFLDKVHPNTTFYNIHPKLAPAGTIPIQIHVKELIEIIERLAANTQS